jgi:hypothetical protein
MRRPLDRLLTAVSGRLLVLSASRVMRQPCPTPHLTLVKRMPYRSGYSEDSRTANSAQRRFKQNMSELAAGKVMIGAGGLSQRLPQVLWRCLWQGYASQHGPPIEMKVYFEGRLIPNGLCVTFDGV